MKIVHTPNQPERKIVAILGSADNGYYRRDATGEVWWLGGDGCCERSVSSWRYLLDSPRVKVYEGDSITITF